jgi:arylformamidase
MKGEILMIYDISTPISSNTPVWPGDPPVSLRHLSEIEEGDNATVTEVQMSVHTGTHIDAASHFISGAQTVDQIPLDKLIGQVLVLDIDPAENVITKKVLKSHGLHQKLLAARKILFRTRNSNLFQASSPTFQTDYVGIDSSGAEYLVQFKLDLIGVDYYSIAPFTETREPHVILLEKEIVLLEGINLSSVAEGFYQLFCLPLNFIGSEGAPARVILIDNFGEKEKIKIQ